LNSEALLIDGLKEKATDDLIALDTFCGCQSKLADYLRDPFGQHRAGDHSGHLTPDALRALLETLKSLSEKTEFVYATGGGESIQRARHLAEGLWWLLQAAQPIGDGKADETTKTRENRGDALKKAVSCLKSLSPGAQHAEKQPKAESDASPELANIFRVASLPRGPWAHEMAWRILEDWGGLDRKPGPQPVGEVYTPVMAASKGVTGAILWLRVRLFTIDPPGSVVGQLIPDLRRMALTEIGDDCLQAFQEVWKLTNLGQWVTGVWSLGEPAPREFERANRGIGVDLPTLTSQINGDSAQAAMLIALLAATGAPETYDPSASTRPTFQLEPLNLQTAISAAVQVGGTENPDGNSIRRCLLKKVGKLPAKANAAYNEGLATIVICDPQTLENAPEIQQALDKTKMSRKAENAAGDYRGLWVEQATTVDDALQILLQSNKSLRAYQAYVQQQWDSNWLQNSPPDNAEKAATQVE
jgi:hypothetical protein